MRLFVSTLLATVAFAASAQAPQTPQQVAYTWKSVQIVGGGFVDGVIYHPTAPGVRYARTDMGGAYRWDDSTKRWQPILDWVPYKDLNLMGVESIAVDASDPKRVYLACGTYTNPRTPDGAILRSDDQGHTFARTDVPFKFGGNEDGRGNGERLAVDPHDGRVLFLGTRHDGLWRSDDRAVTWTRVASFPDVTEAEPPTPARVPGETPADSWRRRPVRGDGIVFVKFAPEPEAAQAAGKHAGTSAVQTIYVGVSLTGRTNLYVSHDGGTSWKPIDNEPTALRPMRAALASDGMLYIAYGTAPGPSRMTNGAVWKLDTRSGAWTDITPDHPTADHQFGYAAVSVDAHHPEWLIASSFGRPGSAGSEDMFRSTDGGKTWKPIFHGGAAGGGVYDYTLAPYVRPTPIHWLFDIEIDPLNSDHATFTTGYGGWETFDLTAADGDKPTHWSALASGIEETVALQFASPTEGAHLISAIGDYGGFVHWDLDHPAPEGASAPPRLGNTSGVVAAALDPAVVVRVGTSAEHKPDDNISYSLDGGRTWQLAGVPAPRSQSGSIAVSADGATWVWTPQGATAYLTHDRGATWKAVAGLPAHTRVIADPMDAHAFYAISLAEKLLYSSMDDGATFTARAMDLPGEAVTDAAHGRGDNRGGQDQVYAVPGRKGDLWLAAFDGLYHQASNGAADSKAAFTHLPLVDEIHAFGFGKAAPGKAYPALYLVGTVSGQAGIFRSIDEAQTWVRINDYQHQWGLVLQIAGDPRIFGRVYVGTHGRGIFYGDVKGE